MMLRFFGPLSSLLVALSVAAPGQDKEGSERKRPDAPAKTDYRDFSRLLQKLAVSKIPKIHEDTSGWGHTVPVPEKLRFPGLRKMVRVGDHMELPHGLWRKVKVWMNDPDKDLRISVRDVKRLDAKTVHLRLETEATFGTAVQAQLWQKGIALPGFAGQADVTVATLIDCDVAVSLIAGKFPPELKVEPKVTDLKMDLKDFTLREVSTLRLGTVLEGERAREVGNQYKGILQDFMHSSEPTVKDYANEAIAKGIREGKGTLGADALVQFLKAAPAKEKKRVAPTSPP